eukprot:c35203_g1_i1 orf=84-272(+)
MVDIGCESVSDRAALDHENKDNYGLKHRQLANYSPICDANNIELSFDLRDQLRMQIKLCIMG